MTIDMDFVESQFPALAGRRYIYLDNAGGSLVLRGVADRVRDYLLTSSVQHGATYSKSREAGEKLYAAQEAVARLINARRPDEVIMGPSTTALLRILATALGETMAPGDEIIVSQAEHEANYGAWERLERKGVKIVEWPVEPGTLRLNPQTLAGLMSPRSKLVCCTHASNIMGTINPVREFADIAHAYGAKICVDAVAYAPHRLIDVQASDADYYAFSFYKVYGPHHAVLYGRYDDLVALPNQNHFFIEPTRVPYKFQPGNVNYELSYGCAAINDYLVELARRDVKAPASERDCLAAAFGMIARQEERICKRLLDYLETVPDVTIHGETSANAHVRVPTISFTVKDRDSADIVTQMDRHNIGIRYGDFYARRLIDSLGLRQRNGVVRVSMVHYNTLAEVDRLIDHLDPIIARNAAIHA